MEKSKQIDELHCTWKLVDMGMYGCNDYVYQTSCGKEYDSDKIKKVNYCLNCGLKVKKYE